MEMLIIHSIYVEVPGHKLCRQAFHRYLGIGRNRVLRCKRNHHGLDKRTLSAPGGFSSQLQFLCSINMTGLKHVLLF